MLSEQFDLPPDCIGSMSIDIHDIVERLDKLIKMVPAIQMQSSSDESESFYRTTDVLAMKAALKYLAVADRVLNVVVGNPNVMVGTT
jgi:uncharacterized membrane protein